MKEEFRVFNIFSRMIIGLLFCIVGVAYGYYSDNGGWLITSSAFTVLVMCIGLFQYITFIRELNHSFK